MIHQTSRYPSRLGVSHPHTDRESSKPGSPPPLRDGALLGMKRGTVPLHQHQTRTIVQGGQFSPGRTGTSADRDQSWMDRPASVTSSTATADNEPPTSPSRRRRHRSTGSPDRPDHRTS